MKRMLLLTALAGCGSNSTADEPEAREINQPGFCGGRGACAASQALCEAVTGDKCHAVDVYACMTLTTQTHSDMPVPLCWATYGQCETDRARVTRDPETKSVSSCVIFRKEKK